MKIYDAEGTERDWAWVRDKYGPDLAIVSDGNEEYEVFELRENIGQMVEIVKVLDENGAELSGINVVWWFDTAPELPDAGWKMQGDVGATEPGKGIHFGMGGGSKYDPAQGEKGPHAVWIYGKGKSSMVDGLGWLAWTNHEHFNVTFKRKGTVPQGPTRYFDEKEGDITEARFNQLMGSAYIERAVGVPRLQIIEAHCVYREKEKRVMEVQVRRADGGAYGDIPIKWDIEGQELAVKKTDESDGFARYKLEQNTIYTVGEKGPMRCRVKRTFSIYADQFLLAGQVRLTGEPNRHVNLVYQEIEDQPQQPPVQPANLRVSYSTRSTLHVEWDESAEAAVYTVAADDAEWKTTSKSYTIAGLLSDTAYMISVAAGNEHGWSDWSVTSGKTLPGPGCDDQLDRIEAKLDALAESQAEGFGILFAKMSIAIEELTKIVALLRLIEEHECE